MLLAASLGGTSGLPAAKLASSDVAGHLASRLDDVLVIVPSASLLSQVGMRRGLRAKMCSWCIKGQYGGLHDFLTLFAAGLLPNPPNPRP